MSSPHSNIVLVGHGISEDLKFLEVLGFHITTPFIGILDTENDARYVSQGPCQRGGLRLKSVLQKLDCPFDKLHIARNDANFTLHELLLLTVENCRSDLLDGHARDMLDRVEALTRLITTSRS